FERTLPMLKQSERSAFGYRSKTNALGPDHEDEIASNRGHYFEFSERAPRMVMAGSAGLAALLLLWSENEAGPVRATDWRANASSTLSAAPQIAKQTAAVEELRRRGLELLRADFPEDPPSPPLPRGDRLELYDPTIRPDMLIAT